MKIQGTAKGEYQFVTVDPNGVERLPLGDTWHENMIVNSGLDMLFNGAPPANATADQGFLSCMAYCRLSASETGSVSDTDTTMTLQQASSGSYVKSNPNGTNTINQVTFDNTDPLIKATFQRTFVFAPSGVSRNWNGVGVSNSPINTDPLFSKAIPGGVVTVQGNEELRVIYKLTLAIPKDTLAIDIDNGGFDGDGQLQAIGTYANLFGGINANGTQTGGLSGSTPSFLRGKIAPTGYLLSNASLPATDTNISPTFVGTNSADSVHTTSSALSYTNGQFYRDFTVTWGAGRPAANVSNIRTLLFGPTGSATHGLAWNLDSNQSKTNTQSLSTTIRVAWGRA
jgi:hypothetical protein